MNERDIRELLIEERKENCALFLKTAAFWKTIVTGIVVIMGLAGGVFAWGLHVNAVIEVNKSDILHSEKRIDRLEKTVNGKLDAILAEVRKK